MSYSSVELVRRYKISPTQIIHVGAWEGLDVPEYKSLGIPKITLVEAMSDKASALRKRYGQDEQVQIIEAAASDTSNETISFYPLAYGSSSLLKPKIESLQQVFADFVALEPIWVHTMKIDDLKIAQANKVMLIVDVQGAELQVLRGATETLKSVILIKIEVSTTAYYEGQSFHDEITAFLMNSGFIKVSERISKKMGQGDAIYMRRMDVNPLVYLFGRLMDLRWKLSIQKINLHPIRKILKKGKLF